MLEMLKVRNFKALRDIEVPLRPFTVLAGPVDSGKSSILQALEALGHCYEGRVGNSCPRGQEERAFQALWSLLKPSPGRVAHHGDRERAIELTAEGTTSAGKAFQYEIGFRALAGDAGEVTTESASLDGQPVIWREDDPQEGTSRYCIRRTDGGAEAAKSAYEALPGTLPILHRYWRYSAAAVEIIEALDADLIRFRADMLAMPCELSTGPAGLDSDGFGLAALLDTMLAGPDRRGFQRIEQALATVVPAARGISLVTTTVNAQDGPHIGKALELVLAAEHDGAPVTVPIGNASDGALLALGYLTLAHADTARCLLVEEPENGLHPAALELVITLLQDIARGAVGPGPRQVILTTHSPLVLELVDAHDVLLVNRTSDGVLVSPMVDTPSAAARLAGFALSKPAAP